MKTMFLGEECDLHSSSPGDHIASKHRQGSSENHKEEPVGKFRMKPVTFPHTHSKGIISA